MKRVRWEKDGADRSLQGLPFLQRTRTWNPWELWGDLRMHELEAGDRMVILPDSDYFLSRGAVGLFQRGSMTRLLTPPAHYRTLETSEGHDLLEALGDGVRIGVLRRPSTPRRPNPHELETRIAAWEDQLDTLRVERRRLQQGLTDLIDPVTFAMPPGPYTMPDAKLYMFVVEDPGLRSRVPKQIRSGLFNDRYILIFASFVSEGVAYKGGKPVTGSKHALTYRETSILVPTWDLFGGGPGLYCVRVHPDSVMAVVLGREVLRFPKRFAETWIAADDPDRIGGAVWALDGQIAAKARWERMSRPLEQDHWLDEYLDCFMGGDLDAAFGRAALTGVLKLDSADGWLRRMGALPIYVRDQRADHKESRDWSRDDLLAIPNRITHVKELRRLEGHGLRLHMQQLRHVDSETWGGVVLNNGVALGGWYANMDLTVENAVAIRDLRRPHWPRDQLRRGIGLLARSLRFGRGNLMEWKRNRAG